MQTNTNFRTDASTPSQGPQMPVDTTITPWKADEQGPCGGAIWHDDLLGGTWAPPAGESEEDEQATVREIESLIGELVAQLES